MKPESMFLKVKIYLATFMETPTSLNGFATRKTAKKILFQIQ